MPKNGKYYLYILISVLIWGSAYPVSRFLVQEMSPYSVVFIRNGATTLIFFLLLPYLKVKIDWKNVKDHAFLLICLGFCGICVNNIFATVGLVGTASGKGSLISSSNILFGTILAVIFLKERLTVRRLSGLFISMFGVFLVLTEGNWNFGGIHPSDLYFFGTAVSWAVYMVMMRYLSSRMDTFVLMPFVFLFGTIASFFFWLPAAKVSPLTGFSAAAWLGMLYMAVFSGAVAFLLAYLGLKQVGTIASNICNSLIPVWACVFAFLFMGETMSLAQIIGTFISVGGVIWGVSESIPHKQEHSVAAK